MARSISRGLSFVAATMLVVGSSRGALAAQPGAVHEPLLQNELGDHVMVGTIRKIDHATGMLTLDAEHMQLDLHFPPPAIEGLKPGEKVAVELAISRTLPAAHRP